MKPATVYSAESASITIALATDPNRHPILVSLAGSVAVTEEPGIRNTLVDAGRPRGGGRPAEPPPLVDVEVDGVLGLDAAQGLVDNLGRMGVVYQGGE